MISADVVIIDSGIDTQLANNSTIVGGASFSFDKEKLVVSTNDFYDEIGHGTAVFNIIYSKNKELTFYIIKIFKKDFYCDPVLLIKALGYVSENVNCSYILLSSGAIVFDNITELESVLKKLNKTNNCLIVSAFNNEGALSYPAASEYVIGVDSTPNLPLGINQYIVYGSPINVITRARSHRVTWLDGKKVIVHGNSFNAAEFLNSLINDSGLRASVVSPGIEAPSNTSTIKFESADFCEAFQPQKNIDARRIAFFPFSKELQVVANNEDLLKYEVAGYYDVRESGKVGLRVCDVSGYGDNTLTIKNIEDLKDDFASDAIVCGHLDMLNQISKCSYDITIEKISNEQGKKVFFFDTKDNRSLTRKEYHQFAKVTEFHGWNFGKLWQINRPVLGVFGTSARQGKFTLQLMLRRIFLEKGYSIKQISTEPTGWLFGMDYTCPIGYNSPVLLKSNDAAKLYNELIHRCDIEEPDLIIVGSQSGTVPANDYHEQYFTFPQYEFLIGTNPDVVLLVVNCFDDIEYINRSINFIESAADCKVIGCVVSFSKMHANSDQYSKMVERIKKNVEKPIFDYDDIDGIFERIINQLGA